jgi:DeoR/GlpR family transcriptional regulator of sugar metabolism
MIADIDRTDRPQEERGMKTQERQRRILERLRAEQREWRVDELARRVAVSAITIRRDLEALAQQGIVLRTHGGCLYAGRMARDVAYHERVATHFELKQAIGKKAAQSVQSGEMILIDDGSTCFHVAVQLRDVTPLSLFTNSMPVVAEVAGLPGLRVTLIGGEYDPARQHLGGPLTEYMLERLTFDRVFLGADAIDKDGWCLTQNTDQTRTAQIMLRRGRRKTLLVDHTKVGAATGRIRYGRLSDFDDWITTPGMEQALYRKFRQMTRVVLAPLS